MTNLKTTVRADCAVSACSPLPLSMKAVVYRLSVGGGASLQTGVHLLLPLSPNPRPGCWHPKQSKLSFTLMLHLYWLLNGAGPHFQLHYVTNDCLKVEVVLNGWALSKTKQNKTKKKPRFYIDFFSYSSTVFFNDLFWNNCRETGSCKIRTERPRVIFI